MRIDVKWGEMDAFGHLNNVHMVRYMESSRIAHADHKLRPELSEKEYSDLIMGRGIGPILKSTFINYRRVTMFPDTLVIATRIKKDSISVDRFTQECIMVSEAQEAIVAHGEAVVVCYDHSKGVKCPLPDAWLRALEN
ncbi:HotDog domain-containing protein [Gorgonomyces haynaldii]|nr:HotDog domain-containing protein [Gorgonomyces haynaldii]